MGSPSSSSRLRGRRQPPRRGELPCTNIGVRRTSLYTNWSGFAGGCSRPASEALPLAVLFEDQRRSSDVRMWISSTTTEPCVWIIIERVSALFRFRFSFSGGRGCSRWVRAPRSFASPRTHCPLIIQKKVSSTRCSLDSSCIGAAASPLQTFRNPSSGWELCAACQTSCTGRKKGDAASRRPSSAFGSAGVSSFGQEKQSQLSWWVCRPW